MIICVKPFAFSELRARIRSFCDAARIACRQSESTELEINVVTHLVNRGPKQLELTQKESRPLLLLLVANTGEILGRKFIA